MPLRHLPRINWCIWWLIDIDAILFRLISVWIKLVLVAVLRAALAQSVARDLLIVLDEELALLDLEDG